MTFVDPIDCPYYLVTRVSLAVTSALKAGFAAANVERVRPAYLGVLFYLWQTEGLKVVELGRKAGLEPSTMTGLLDRMERDGLVVRSPDPDDRRAQLIFLTEEGRRARVPVTDVVNHTLSQVFENTADKDLTHLKRTLRQVLANLHEGSES